LSAPAYIRYYWQILNALRSQGVGYFPQVGGVTAGNHDSGSGSSECLRAGFPDSRRGSGYDHNFVFHAAAKKREFPDMGLWKVFPADVCG
jgi:hypothetical protein